MATIPTRFDFHCNSDTEKLSFIHNVPSSLIGQVGLQSNPGLISLFTSTVGPIVQEHEAACRAKSSLHCDSCGGETVKTLMTPMSWLHVLPPHVPFVNVWVTPACGKAECELKLRQQIQDMMAMMGRQAAEEGIGGEDVREAMACKVCGLAKGVQRCGRCKVIGYCGREHQKEDWNAHKVLCKAIARK